MTTALYTTRVIRPTRESQFCVLPDEGAMLIVGNGDEPSWKIPIANLDLAHAFASTAQDLLVCVADLDRAEAVADALRVR